MIYSCKPLPDRSTAGEGWTSLREAVSSERVNRPAGCKTGDLAVPNRLVRLFQPPRPGRERFRAARCRAPLRRDRFKVSDHAVPHGQSPRVTRAMAVNAIGPSGSVGAEPGFLRHRRVVKCDRVIGAGGHLTCIL